MSVEASALAQTTEIFLSIIGLTAALLGAGVGMLVGRRYIAAPLKRVVDNLGRVAGGNLDVVVDEADRKDEIGALNQALERFIADARDRLQLLAAQEADAAAKVGRSNKLQALTSSFKLAIDQSMTTLASAADEMRATAASMSATAEETSAQTQSVSSTTQQTSSNVQTVAAASEQLSSTISEVSKQMVRGSDIARSAAKRTEEALTCMDQLSTTVQEIDQILTVIMDVTRQTNLLALNATIEAARAGEAGRGFGVVAAEVKELAAQTERATGTVAQQIGSIKASTGAVIEAVRHLATTVGEVNEVTTSVAASAEQQVSATSEISRNVAEAASGTEHVAKSIVMLQTTSQSAAAASSQVASTAEELARQSNAIKREITVYLEAVAAA